LWRESTRLLGDIDRTLQTLREDFADAKKVIRVGVSRSVRLTYLPGFFHANLRRLPGVGYRVSNRPTADILTALESNELDLGVFCPPRRLPPTVRVTHRFKDTFVLVGSVEAASQFAAVASRRTGRLAWLNAQNWLMLDEQSNTGRQLRTWLTRQRCRAEPAMQLDSFDLIINLVALGMGVGFVPSRALALYHRKRTLRRLDWPNASCANWWWSSGAIAGSRSISCNSSTTFCSEQRQDRLRDQVAGENYPLARLRRGHRARKRPTHARRGEVTSEPYRGRHGGIYAGIARPSLQSPKLYRNTIR
jgi:DNA-binding transcriptional LysR family regulator